MARETKSAAIQGDLQNLSATMELNKDQLPDLEPFRLGLAGIVAQLVDTTAQQSAMKVSKQEYARQHRQLLIEGQAMANLIRVAVKKHFGPRAEKVAEFGLQPFRGRKVKAAPEKPEPTTPPATAGPVETVKSDL